MALKTCPECGKTNVSEFAKACPICGYPLTSYFSEQQKTSDRITQKKHTLSGRHIAVLATITLIIIVAVYYSTSICNLSGCNNWKSSSGNGFCRYHEKVMNERFYGTTSSTGSAESRPNSSTIFSNLSITNFSAKADSYGGKMSCEVTNNNDFTITGYFYVNFYDSSGILLYNQLMSIPDVSSGEKVSCSTYIPKSEFDVKYDYVDFSQANLTTSD